MNYELRSARFLAADCLKRVIEPGDRVIDATMGNGHDTCMLAELVGATGTVFAFDLQQQAVENTEASLRERGLLTQCMLFAYGHEHIAEHVFEPIRAAVFNLGWLPGGDKSVTTHWETTKIAVDACLALLEKGGVCTICAYPGHAAGDEERRALTEYLSTLRPQDFNVLHQHFLNAGEGAPECYIIQRNPD